MSEERDYRASRKKYGKASSGGGIGIISKLIALIATAVGAWFVYQAYNLNMFPIKFLGAGAVMLLIVLLLVWVMVFRRSLAARVIGSLFALLLCAGLGLGAYYVQETRETLNKVTGGAVTVTTNVPETDVAQPGETAAEGAPAEVATTTRRVLHTDELTYVVMSESTMAALNDLAGAKLGVQAVLDRDNTNKALEDLKGKLTTEPVTVEYNGMADMIQALYDKEVDAVLFNEAYRELVKDEFTAFDEETKTLESVVYEEEVEETLKKEVTDVTKDPFIVYFSGIDTYGDISARSRSDVNILAVVNPTTKQILLVTTPRDYYVELPVAGNAMDKLTHAGIYGISASEDALEQLYDISIHFYVRMNFTGFMNIVDALGGVDVYSAHNFTGEVYGYSFTKGYNHVDGQQALSFVRERHSFADGDFQRQRNQLEMVKAIVKKIASPSILTTYTALLANLENSFTTDMPADQISALVKMQLDKGGDWNVQSYGVSGKGARKTTYSMGNRSLYVALQDPDSIQGAKDLMQKVMEGGILTDDDTQVGNQE